MAAAAVWREQGGKKWPRVWGGAGVAPFVPARNTAGRPIPDRRPGSRLASWAGKRPTRAEEGDARRAVSAARLLAVGLRAQEEAAEQAAGRFRAWVSWTVTVFYCFFYFSEAFSIEF